jgi:Zn-dependent protease with chaperone function
MSDPSSAPSEPPRFSPADRELFDAAIARHRRASWRVTAACAVAAIVVMVVVAILMAPLLYCLFGLGFDLVNLFTPAPDVIGSLGRAVDRLVNAKTISAAALIQFGVVAAAPGLVLMTIAMSALRHLWRRSPLFGAGSLPGRPPNRAVLAEERLANVVEEMAIAAGVPVPRIAIVSGGNAAVCGSDASHATIVAGEWLAGSVDRDQLEGMIAHLIGSLANGDLAIGMRVTTTLTLFGLIAHVGTSFDDRQSFRQTAKLWRVFVAPTSENTATLLSALADPFRKPSESESGARPRSTPHNGKLTWREWLLMPLMGPVLIAGFLCGMVTAFLLEPLVALAWRQRKYMADATAVQLTRNPDGLAGALDVIARSPMGIEPWIAHMAVAPGPRDLGPFGRSAVPVFPSMERRGRALVRMGAHVAVRPRSRMPWWLTLILGGLGAFVGILLCIVIYLLVIVSAALSGLFTIMPAAVLHFLLRWLAR